MVFKLGDHAVLMHCKHEFPSATRPVHTRQRSQATAVRTKGGSGAMSHQLRMCWSATNAPTCAHMNLSSTSAVRERLHSYVQLLYINEVQVLAVRID